ncbi:MAG: ribonuclease P protein component [Candidatus Saccharibacteria bacterium]
MISFINRFHGHGSLRYVYQNGQAIRSRSVTLKTIHNKTRKNSRIAVVVSKKVLKSAVGRNRIRRRVYEYIRSQLPEFTGVYDVVIIVTNNELLTVTYDEIISQISQVLGQAGIVKN